jgi:DNA-binding sugar fermentation-stimulating protein
MVLFVIQRADAGQLRPNRETDPGFAAALQRAGEVGVVLAAHTCRVTTSYLSLDRAVPVRTD